MRYAAQFFLLLLPLLAGPGFGLGRLDAAEPVRLRVLSYNIHHGRGNDGKIDLERIGRVIRGAKPDIVALQECDRKTDRSGGVDQPAELGRLTAMHVIFQPNIDFQGGQYGNVVLSKRKPDQHVYHRLPSLAEGEQRGVLDVTLRLADGGPRIRFLATHLDHRPNDAERLASGKKIEELTGAKSNPPTVLAGDLNAMWESPVLDRFRTHWTLAKKTPILTFPASSPKRQIDYILFRPADRWRTVSAHAVEAPDASDHRPIFAELELIGP